MNTDTVNPIIAPPTAARDPVPTDHALSRRDAHFFEELSRVNNELANLQRETARTNADLATAHKEIEASEQRYRNLSACSPIGILELDAADRCLYANPQWQTITGLTAEESLGDGWQRALDPRDAPDVMEEWNLARRANLEFSRELRFVNPRGGPRCAQVRSRSIHTGRGEIAGHICTVEDITERKRAGEALHRSEMKFRTVYDSTTDAITLMDETGLLDCNLATLAMFGYATREEFCSKHPADLSPPVQPDGTDSRTLANQRIATAMEKGSNRFEWMHKRAGTGETFPAEVLLNTIELDGKPAIQVVVRDITERKQAHAEQEKLERRLAEHRASEESARLALEHEQKSSQIKNRFVSLVSHEFRTPLSVINMAAELLDGYLDKMTDAERSEHLNEIKSSVERMTQMMNDFLVHGNCANGKIECQPARVEVEALCRRLILEVLECFGQARGIECVIDPAVGEAWLDEKILRHILVNLLSNAVKYSSAGQPVKLEVKRVVGSPKPNGGTDPSVGTHLEFKVTDSGIGIPAADMAKLYQTFHRAANVGNRPGTGMGLAIVKQFVELHRGSIRIESQEGKGTTVWVWLPTGSPVLRAGS
jgi:PAS domain S-box-containing protein